MDHRPRYHFLPPSGWMNDPNGLIHWRGRYHLFYQYNPDAPRWQRIHWGHAVSDDLAHWEHLPIALTPEENSPDESGCWSGCAVADGDELKLIYTASKSYNPELDSADIQICMASSHDGINFTKDPEPLLQWPWGTKMGEHVLVGFRDPGVWFQHGSWYMTVGAGFAGRGPAVLLYQSTNLKTWSYLGPLLEDSEMPGDTPPGSMWECPQLIKLAKSGQPSTYVLLVCPWKNRRGFQPTYFIGRCENDRFHPARTGIFDVGDLYAPQAMRDAQGRWLLWGWIREAYSPVYQTGSDWSGVMSLPRVICVGENGRIEQGPAPELVRLRRKKVEWTGFSLQAGERLFLARGSHYELHLRTAATASFTLLLRASPDGAEQSSLSYDHEMHQLTLDRSKSSLDPRAATNHHQVFLGPASQVDMRVFLDGSVIEVFAQNQALASRIYPSRVDSVNLVLSSDQPVHFESIELWEMSSSETPDPMSQNR